MRTKKKPVIIIPYGSKKKICKACGVSPETVRKALKFITESDEADKIRREALNNYGGTLIEVNVRI
ncbi:MAG: hypothetical protein ACLRPS_04815 [Paraprevotella clara]|uniref:Uncharacterized protein n=1 Tax=Paraprevotella clara TaxID=454154 RepID=A0A6N3EXV4_9BACT